MKDNIIPFTFKKPKHDIKLLDGFINIHLPAQIEQQHIKDAQEQYKEQAYNAMRHVLPSELLDRCKVQINTDLIVTAGKNLVGGYDIEYCLIFTILATDEDGNTLYEDTSDNFDAGFDEADKHTIKTALAVYIMDIFFPDR